MKSWKVIYTIDAKKHIESAIEYYNSLSIGLGKRFSSLLGVGSTKHICFVGAFCCVPQLLRNDHS